MGARDVITEATALTENAPPESVVDDAVRVSRLSPCRSKRGAVTFLGDTVLTSGCNHQVSPLTCDGSDRCKATCRHTAVHAEQVALALVGTNLRGCDLLHVKTVDGALVPSGPPSCVQCSKLAVLAGIRFVWLYHEDGWRAYEAGEFHRLSAEHALRLLLAERETREQEIERLKGEAEDWQLAADGIKHHFRCARNVVTGDPHGSICDRCRAEDAESIAMARLEEIQRLKARLAK